jgi:hypothetical protein
MNASNAEHIRGKIKVAQNKSHAAQVISSKTESGRRKIAAPLTHRVRSRRHWRKVADCSSHATISSPVKVMLLPSGRREGSEPGPVHRNESFKVNDRNSAPNRAAVRSDCRRSLIAAEAATTRRMVEGLAIARSPW